MRRIADICVIVAIVFSMLYLTCTLPVLLYLLIIKGMDGLSLVRSGRLAQCFLWGVAACLICFEIPSSPWVEEALKVLPLVVAIYRGRSAFLSQAVLYGAAVGAGFACLENILYVAFSDGFTLGDAIVRGFGTSLLHIGCTLLAASSAMLACRVARRWTAATRIAFSLTALLPSMAIHYLYNSFFLPEYIQMALVVCLVTILVMYIFNLDSRLTVKWLDSCISNDVSLLQSIRKGQLQNTNAGQYLLAARDHFQKEVFFDICVYLGLYLELSIAAKSRMIMKDAGMDIRPSAQEHKLNSSKIEELSCLKKRIGKAGQMFLAPLVHQRTVDDWVISELL